MTSPAAVGESAPSRTDQALLRLAGLRVSFLRRGRRTDVLAGVDLEVPAGRAVAVVGESGSGKTVTMRAPFGLLPPTAQVSADAASFDGLDLLSAGRKEVRGLLGSRIGMVYQNALNALNPTLTISRQLSEVLLWHGVCSKREARQRVLDALADVGMPDPRQVAAQYPFQLSGGMRQRAMIAMATIGSPALLVADEPTTAIDVTLQRQVLDLLAAQRERGMSVVLVTHDLGVARYFCDDLVVMYAGRVLESGPTADVLAAPTHPYTRGLLASTLEIGGGRGLEAIPGNPVEPGRWPTGCPFAPRCPQAEDRCREPQLLRVLGNRRTACWKAES